MAKWWRLPINTFIISFALVNEVRCLFPRRMTGYSKHLPKLKAGLILPGDKGFTTKNPKSGSETITTEELALQAKLREIKIPEKSRPDFGLSGATGRSTEFVFSADPPLSTSEASNWAIRCLQKNIGMVLVLDGPMGTVAETLAECELASMVTVLDPMQSGCCAAALAIFSEAKASRTKVVITCSAGERATALVLGAYVMQVLLECTSKSI
jgi:hypothetical protein